MESSYLLSLLLALGLATIVQGGHFHGGPRHHNDQGHGYSRFGPHHRGGKPHGDFYKPIDIRYGKPPPSYKPASSYHHGYEDTYEEPKYEEQSYEGPKYEESFYEAPKYEEPKYEEHQYEPQTYEEHKVQPPKYEPPKQSYSKPQPIKYKSKGECTFRGQYLPDPSNKCAFRRCIVQSEPWEEYGEIPLDIIGLMCAPGSAVSSDYKGGESNPCTEFDDTCGVSTSTYKHPEPSYKPPPKYEEPHTYEEPKPAPKYKPSGECTARGMHLPDPADKCKYRRCVVQSEPWEKYGEIPLDVISLPCPPGTAVPSDYTGGYDSPCVEFDESCGSSESHSYPAPEPPKSYADPPKPSYPSPAPAPSYNSAPVPAPAPTYAPASYTPPKPKGGECKARGMHLPDPADKCMYRRCVVQSEPWEEYGEIPLDVISLPCPPGTAVPSNYAGGYDSPCTEFDDSCKAATPKSYPAPDPPKTYADPPKMSYPAPEPPKPSYPLYEPPKPSYPPPAPSYNPAHTSAPQPINTPPKKPKGECKARGMHLADPGDKCKYRRCVVQSEPWEEYGEIPLDIISLPCPPGTAVPSTYTSGYSSPCTEFDDSCTAPHSYPKARSYPVPQMSEALIYEEPKTPVYKEPKAHEPPATLLEENFVEPSYPPVLEPTYPPEEEEEEEKEEKEEFIEPTYPPMEETEEEEEEEVEQEEEEEPEPTYPPVEVEQAQGGCQHRGQLLRNPADKCSYVRCIIGSEPWQVAGDIPLTMVAQDCAVGTSVPQGYRGGLGNPCTVFDSECGTPSPQLQETEEKYT